MIRMRTILAGGLPFGMPLLASPAFAASAVST